MKDLVGVRVHLDAAAEVEVVKRFRCELNEEHVAPLRNEQSNADAARSCTKKGTPHGAVRKEVRVRDVDAAFGARHPAEVLPANRAAVPEAAGDDPDRSRAHTVEAGRVLRPTAVRSARPRLVEEGA